MTKDLLADLRRLANASRPVSHRSTIFAEAADEIERLRAKFNPANREPPHCPSCSCHVCLCSEGFPPSPDCMIHRPAVEPSGEQVLREGKCEKCGNAWIVKGDPTAVVSVLAVHCTCGHVNK